MEVAEEIQMQQEDLEIVHQYLHHKDNQVVVRNILEQEITELEVAEDPHKQDNLVIHPLVKVEMEQLVLLMLLLPQEVEAVEEV